MIKDILLKAAEDVQQGLWCQWYMFTDGTHMWADQPEALRGIYLENTMNAKRCATGSLALSTALLGGTNDDYKQVLMAVAHELPEHYSESEWSTAEKAERNIIAHNDFHMGSDDPFTGGQFWADIFRTAADKL